LVYGSTIHEVVEFYLKRRVEGNYTALDDLLAEYDTKWVNQGFLTWEHQEARKAAGREALTRFWNQEETAGVKPTYIEKDFAFSLGPTRVRRRFEATPSRNACRWFAYRQICPFTATRE